jgi:hypothetical protein
MTSRQRWPWPTAKKAMRTARDKAYTHLKLAVDEVRDAGLYVFYNDDDRKTGYISKYLKRVRDRYNSSKTQQQSQKNKEPLRIISQEAIMKYQI